VKYDQRYERRPEVELLIGNPAKAGAQLGWEHKVRFKELVKIMVEHDLHLAKYKLQPSQLPKAI
jgi:GDPmannose 4,6-dehydratase